MEASAVEGADDLERMIAAAVDCLQQLSEQNGWLLWLDFTTTLPPWDVPEDFLEAYFSTEAEHEGEEEAPESLDPLPNPVTGVVDPNDDVLYERLQSTCAAAVSYLDAGIGLLRERLLQSGGAMDTLLVVTSDVGTPLGEHGIVGSAESLPHEELIHLPLLIRLPGGKEGGRRVSALTQAVDLAPTLGEVFALRIPSTMHGRSLWPLLRGEREALRAYALCATEAVRTGWCLRTPEWSLLAPPSDLGLAPQLFRKPEDRWHINDLAARYVEWTEYLAGLLQACRTALERPGPLEWPALQDMREV